MTERKPSKGSEGKSFWNLNPNCVPICPKEKVYQLVVQLLAPSVCVKITSLNRDAIVGEKCVINLIEVNSHRNKKPKKSGGKGSVAL